MQGNCRKMREILHTPPWKPSGALISQDAVSLKFKRLFDAEGYFAAPEDEYSSTSTEMVCLMGFHEAFLNRATRAMGM